MEGRGGGGGGGEGGGYWRAPQPHKSLNGSGQRTFTGGTRDLCARRGGVEGELERERERERTERDRSTIRAYILFITLCNMHQKN